METKTLHLSEFSLILFLLKGRETEADRYSICSRNAYSPWSWARTPSGVGNSLQAGTQGLSHHLCLPESASAGSQHFNPDTSLPMDAGVPRGVLTTEPEAHPFTHS